MFEAIKSLFERIFQSDRLGGARRSSDWSRVRNDYAKKNPFCAVCGKKKIQIHHEVPFSVNPELELRKSNLISLCMGFRTNKCHILFGHLTNWKSYNKNVREDAILWRTKIQQRP